VFWTRSSSFSFLHVIFLLPSSSGLTGYQGFARLEGGRLILEGVASLCSGRAILGCFPSSCFFFCTIYIVLYTLLSRDFGLVVIHGRSSHYRFTLLYSINYVSIDWDALKCLGKVVYRDSNRLA
jgi:hypothetical protein